MAETTWSGTMTFILDSSLDSCDFSVWYDTALLNMSLRAKLPMSLRSIIEAWLETPWSRERRLSSSRSPGSSEEEGLCRLRKSKSPKVGCLRASGAVGIADHFRGVEGEAEATPGSADTS